MIWGKTDQEMRIVLRPADAVRSTQHGSFGQFVVQYGVYLSLALLLAIAGLVSPNIYSSNTLFLILRQASQLGLVAVGQTLVMLVGGLDLSVTGVIVLTSVVIAEVGAGQNERILPGVALALALGVLIGLGNGLLVTKRNVPPFIATLGMLVLIRGAQLAHTRGIPSGQVPRGLGVLSASVGPVPLSFLAWILITVLLAYLLYATPFGRRLYAVGSNREAARLAGVPVDRLLISVYILCGVMAALAGVVLSGYVGYVDRYLGRGFDLDSITAAVVGGASFGGGRGNLLGTMAGVLLVQFLSSLLLVMGLDVQAQLIVKGLVVIGAVALYAGFAHRM
jgi:ribose/xylose/arabinose/galactoside ABC-type transport system permease subunit